MKSFAVLAVLAGVASAWKNQTEIATTTVAPPAGTSPAPGTPIWITTTKVVKSYTTYCPSPTTVVQGNHTYTVTEATTLTITDCPCTATTTIPAFTTYCPSPTTVVYSSQTYVVSTPGTATIPITTPIPVAPTTAPVVPGSPETPATTAPVVPGSPETPATTAPAVPGSPETPATSVPAGVVPVPAPSPATNTPSSPSSTPIEVLPGSGAGKNAAGVGALLAAGVALLL